MLWLAQPRYRGDLRRDTGSLGRLLAVEPNHLLVGIEMKGQMATGQREGRPARM